MPKPYTLEWWESKADKIASAIDRHDCERDSDWTYAQLILAASEARYWVRELSPCDARCPNCNTEFGADGAKEFPIGGDHDV